MFEHLSEEEWQAVTQRWEQGRMKRYVGQLPVFVERHREQILARALHSTQPGTLLTATKLVLLDIGSLDQRDDMTTQRKKISDHIWIGVERGAQDPMRLADDWVVNYAVRWRLWRMKKYIYVINRCADDVVAQLQAPPPEKQAPAA